jgi:hypothetical protein
MRFLLFFSFRVRIYLPRSKSTPTAPPEMLALCSLMNCFYQSPFAELDFKRYELIFIFSLIESFKCTEYRVLWIWQLLRLASWSFILNCWNLLVCLLFCQLHFVHCLGTRYLVFLVLSLKNYRFAPWCDASAVLQTYFYDHKTRQKQCIRERSDNSLNLILKICFFRFTLETLRLRSPSFTFTLVHVHPRSRSPSFTFTSPSWRRFGGPGPFRGPFTVRRKLNDGNWLSCFNYA